MLQKIISGFISTEIYFTASKKTKNKSDFSSVHGTKQIEDFVKTKKQSATKRLSFRRPKSHFSIEMKEDGHYQP